MKTLIAYTTEYGTATLCAEKIKEGLHSDVEIVNLSETRGPSIQDYDIIILGGGVHMGKIGREMRRFIKKDIDILKTKKLFLFLCCLEKNIQDFFEKSFPPEVLDIAIDRYDFGGIIEMDKLSRTHQMVLKTIGQDKNRKKIKDKNIKKLCKAINSL